MSSPAPRAVSPPLLAAQKEMKKDPLDTRQLPFVAAPALGPAESEVPFFTFFFFPFHLLSAEMGEREERK